MTIVYFPFLSLYSLSYIRPHLVYVIHSLLYTKTQVFLHFHIRCFVNILNLIVQDGLKVASDTLHKIRQSVHYIRASESRMKQFSQCVEQVGRIDTSIGVRSYCIIRWNFIYKILEIAIKYRRTFHSLSLIDKNYKWCPSNDE